MKIACSSASFSRAIADGTLTQLEWLDLCANELELDGIVFDAAHFPRTDDDYLAQLKKLAADLGLTVAALAADDVFSATGERHFTTAVALGAPLLVAPALPAVEDPGAWGAFTAVAHDRASLAKRLNITLSVRNAERTLCTNAADLRRLAKDVDSAWLRYALAPLTAGPDAGALLPKTAIAVASLDAIAQFATSADDRANSLIHTLSRFRGFIVLDSIDTTAPRDAYHHALDRFTTLRSAALTTQP
jgi:hypothetical protein